MDSSGITPNALAWVALFAWPPLVLAVYGLRQGRYSIAATTAWMLVLPEMFLPSNLTYKVLGIPGLDKHRIATLSVVVALEFFHTRRLWDHLRSHAFPRFVLMWLVAGVLQTVRTNGDELIFGPTVLPRLTGHDALSISFGLFLDLYLPFVVGQRVFRSERDLRDLLKVLAMCAPIYLPLILVELFLSPQMHRWVYGYHPSEFAQHVRGGGFRPMVFMNHGLALATFLFSAFGASLTLLRSGERIEPSPSLRVSAAGALVALCRSLGAFLYSLGAVLSQLLLSAKNLGRVIALVGVLVISYPMIRTSNLLPLANVVHLFSRISADRADSLLFRFDQEEQLLARFRERPVFGWGSWGRNQIFAPWGQNLSIVDGYWVGVLGAFGYVGFVGSFALLVVPLFRFVRCRARMPPRSQVLAGGLAYILAMYAVDNMPNNAMVYLPLVWAGALFSLSGHLGRPAARRGQRRPSEAPSRPSSSDAGANREIHCSECS